ncbi:hypothetical protein FISHEDRAFT_14117, partial [Fistulina hepatica ATCC 64428]
VTVFGHSFTVIVEAFPSLAIRTGTMQLPAYVNIAFTKMATTNYGENIYVVGNITELGNWDLASSIALFS